LVKQINFGNGNLSVRIFHTGYENMKKNFVLLTPCFLTLILVMSACANPTTIATSVLPSLATPTPTVVATATNAPLPTPTENPLHSLGQLVKLNGLSLVLTGVDYTQSQLQVTFAAKNFGSDIVSAFFIDFSASAADGTKLKSDACFITDSNSHPDYAVPSFGGSLQPGENLKGTICWKSVAPNGEPLVAQTGITVAYTPEGSAKPVGSWDVSNAGKVDAPVELALSDFATPPYKQAEAVKLKDITVSFDGITFQAVGQDKTRVVLAHFTFENNSSATYKFGIFLSYSFSIKLADGSPLGTDFTTVGCQNTASNVVILPAQKQTYTLCFVDPGTTSLAPGSLVIFFPNPDEGNKVFWMTE
jgi:hypothetical protein